VPVDRHLSATQLAIGADGTFTASGMIPGEYTLALPEDGEWALVSAECDGRDALRQSIALTPGEHHLQVEATDQRAVLSVDVSRSADVDVAMLLIFPSGAMQNGPFRDVPVTAPATRIREVLPAGSYHVVAIAHGAFDGDWREPDVLLELERLASTVTLVNGQTTQLEVRAIDVQ
jgi:hypothetical protein